MLRCDFTPDYDMTKHVNCFATYKPDCFYQMRARKFSLRAFFELRAGILYTESWLTVLMAKRMLAVLIALMLMCGCANAQSTKPLARQGFMLDTVISISLYDNQDEAILDGAFALCEEYEQLFSRTISTSDVYRINHSDGAPVEVPDAHLQHCCCVAGWSIARLSGGGVRPYDRTVWSRCGT